MRIGDWSQNVPANAGLTVTLDGATWTLTGHERGSNRTGEHWFEIVSGAETREVSIGDLNRANKSVALIAFRASFDKAKARALRVGHALAREASR